MLITTALLLTGCASVNMTSQAESDKAKEFSMPSEGNAGVYVYRDSFVGKALKKDLWIDGECLGESANGVFFHKEVAGNQKHKIETESEFSPNALEIFMESGKNYFVRQFIKMGVFVGGSDLQQVTEAQGKVHLAKLQLAQSGNCSK